MTVVPFRGPRERAETAELRSEAEALVEAVGARAGLLIGRMARLPETCGPDRARLLALAEEIERIQGFAWFGQAGAAAG